MDALVLDPLTPMEEDRRRQPMQAQRIIYGVLPSDFDNRAIPAEAIVPGGYLSDYWLHP